MKVKELVKMLQDCEFQDAEILPVANLTKENIPDRDVILDTIEVWEDGGDSSITLFLGRNNY